MEAHDVTEEKGCDSEVSYQGYCADTVRNRSSNPLPVVDFHSNLCSHMWPIMAFHELASTAVTVKKDTQRPKREDRSIGRENLKFGSQLEHEQLQRR